jgi:hypothetical protein
MRRRFVSDALCPPVGKTLSISFAAVKRDWDFVHSWLLSQME